ncbi:MAG TPA: metallophosphoesterase [Gammaproteobacteria bacterium]
MPTILQFTDLHLRDDPAASVRGVVSQRSFDEALYHAHRHHWPADAVLLTGDLANDEYDRTYVRLAGIAARWETPVLFVPGNHDNKTAMDAAFNAVPMAADNVIDFEHWRIVGLDSQVPGAVHGDLSADMWRLLEDAAATRGKRRLLVCLHHHPLSLGSPWLENLGLKDAAGFRGRLGALGVHACLFGHAHQEWDSMENGVRYLGTPSTGRQFAAHSDTFTEADQPPAYRWLRLHDDGEIETAVEWVEKM